MKTSLSENALAVLNARYLRRDEDGCVIETPDELFERVAVTVAAAEARYKSSAPMTAATAREFYRLMTGLYFLPNSPTLMNAGRKLGMLSACFVLPVNDSIESIFESVKDMALIQRAGGGTGFAFDSLRPTGDIISSSGGPTSGPVSFWKVFNEATNAVQQGAFRRGANMAMCHIQHPDILKFIVAKHEPARFNNFNVSIKVTDDWMRMVEQQPDAPHPVVNPRTGDRFLIPRHVDLDTYRLQDLLPLAGGAATPVRVWTVRELWNLIVDEAWRTGEPGLAFIDCINRANPTPHLGSIQATNPCGEQPLLPYEACNLGSLNLAQYVKDRQVQWNQLRRDVFTAVRFLDDAIEINRFPIKQTRRICLDNRKIGLGVMGFADALIAMETAYDSDQAVDCGRKIMHFINDAAHDASEALATERGVFPNWEQSVWGTRKRRQRNATVTTVAPTGTLSIIADCSAGIEPLYNLVFYRRILNGQLLRQVHAPFQRKAAASGFASDELFDYLGQGGSLRERDDVPPELRRIFVCAHDVSPEHHVKMQAAFQESCDAAISKTINFANSATVDDVERVYWSAFNSGCKGVTVYRDGCRRGQPMGQLQERSDNVPPPSPAAAPAGSCPNCGAVLEKVSGCRICENCGFTSCAVIGNQ